MKVKGCSYLLAKAAKVREANELKGVAFKENEEARMNQLLEKESNGKPLTQHETKVLFLKREDNPCNKRKIMKGPVMH